MIDCAAVLGPGSRLGQIPHRRTNHEKMTALIMVAALAVASTAGAQIRKISPKGIGGFGSGTTLPDPRRQTVVEKGPNRTSRFRSSSVAASVWHACRLAVPTPDGLPVSSRTPRFSRSPISINVSRQRKPVQLGTARSRARDRRNDAMRGRSLHSRRGQQRGRRLHHERPAARQCVDESVLRPALGLHPAERPLRTVPDGSEGLLRLADQSLVRQRSSRSMWTRSRERFGPHSSVLIAVSLGTSPFSGFFLYDIDVTNDGTGGTPSHPGCPCFGDQPLIGADAHAFWVSTNEFPISRPASTARRSTPLDKAGHGGR